MALVTVCLCLWRRFGQWFGRASSGVGNGAQQRTSDGDEERRAVPLPHRSVYLSISQTDRQTDRQTHWQTDTLLTLVSLSTYITDTQTERHGNFIKMQKMYISDLNGRFCRVQKRRKYVWFCFIRGRFDVMNSNVLFSQLFKHFQWLHRCCVVKVYISFQRFVLSLFELYVKT